MKSETHFSRETIENQRGKKKLHQKIPLKFCQKLELCEVIIAQNYTENANGDVRLILKNIYVIIVIENSDY